MADGMCADAAIHDPYPPGHNPHAHILLTVRPLDEKGKWQYKTEKEYLCVKDGEEHTRVIAETGAGQHGVATATVAALMGLCLLYTSTDKLFVTRNGL